MTTRSLFSQAFAQTGQDSDADPAGWTFGLQLSSSDPVAWVTGVWWRPSSITTTAYDWRVYSGHVGETITLLDSGALGSYVAGGPWQLFEIDPVDVSGINFQVAVKGGDDTYAYATGKFPASNGSLSGNGSSSGSFNTAGGAPNNGSALAFMIDANVSDTAPGGDPEQGSMSLTQAISLAAAARPIARGSLAVEQAVALTAAGRLVPLASLAVEQALGLTIAGREVQRAAMELGVSVALAMTPSGAIIIPGTLTPGSLTAATLAAGSTSIAGLIAT